MVVLPTPPLPPTITNLWSPFSCERASLRVALFSQSPPPKYWSAGTPLTSRSRKGEVSCSRADSMASSFSMAMAFS